MNIPQAFEKVARQHPKSIPLEMGEKGYSYEEILSSSKSIASFLFQRGVKKGDRVAILLEGRPEWGIVYLGISFLGAVAVPIDIQLSSEEVRNLLEDSESKVIFVSQKTTETNKTGFDAINIDSDVFSEIVIHPHMDSFPSIDPGDIASLIYTSGTTGKPKGVVLTHGNLLSNVRSVQKANIINERDCLLSILPLHHSYPFMVNFLVPILTGAKVVYLQSLKGPDVLKTIAEKNVTVLVGVPQLLVMFRRGMLDNINKLTPPFRWIVMSLMRLSGFLRDTLKITSGRIIFYSLYKRFGKQFRFFVSGGAKLDPLVSQDLEALGFTILEGYGLTETSPVISFNPPKRIKRGSVGLPLSEVEIKVINANDEGIGEIAVRGPNVMKGYYRNPEETDQVIKGEWFHTGDLGYVDEDGYLYITGRTKEVIVLSSGKNIYPEEIEKHYLQSPLIKEICVFGEGKAQGIADALKAVIVPNIEYMKGKNISNFNEAVKWQINSLSSEISPYKRIMGYEVYQHSLPRTTLGKLKRYVIKDIISGKFAEEESQISEEEREILESPAGKVVVGSLERILEKRPIRIDHNLELDLGIDSMARVELIVALSSALSIELPDTFMTDIHSVRDMIQKIEKCRENLVKELVTEVPKEWKEFFKIEPSSEDQRAVGLAQGTLTKLFIIFALNFLRITGKVLFRLEVKGIENIPAPPYIITPNHASNIDGFVIGTVVPTKTYMNLYFLGFQKYFSNWFTSRFARLAHVIPVDPEIYLKKALLMSGHVLKKRKALCLFPEGGRTFDGKLLTFKKGVGILSKELNVPLVPTFIEGTFEVLPRGATWPKLRKIEVTFGRPIYPEETDFSGKPSDIDDYEWIVLKLKEAILQMKK